MNLNTQKKKGIQLNITSLIDVMFILIIFYSVTSTFLEQPGFDLQLPKASGTETVRIKDNVLFVYPDSTLIISEKKIQIDSLRNVLILLKQNLEKKSLILQADENIPNGFVVRIMDIATQAGFDELTISTEIEK